MFKLSRLIKFRILTFIVSLIVYLPLAQAQNEAECLELTQAQNTPTDIINAASNIIVGYRNTNTFKPIEILNSDNLPESLNPIELPISEEGLGNRYMVVELSPDHQKILQIFSNDADELTLRVSSVIDGSVVSTEIAGILDAGYAPRWVNSQTILLDTNQSDTLVYSYTIFSLESSSIDTLSFDLSSQPIPLEEPQLSPNLSNLVFLGRENNSRRIYTYSDTTQVSVPVYNSITSVIGLQWSTQENYISFLHDFNASSLPQSATIVSIDGELITTRDMAYGEPVMFPRSSEITWSPNERYIAYQNETSDFREQIGSRTSVIDLESQELLNICIPGNLFWSPTSQYAALFLRTPPSSSPPNEVLGLFVIDINSHEMYEIPIDNMEDIGLEVGWFDPMSSN